MTIKDLEIHLKNKISNLNGEWIKNNSSYDSYISNILNFKDDPSRYWDSQWDDLRIEFKKGRSIWLDLVRYAEIYNKINDDAKKRTVTLFFIPNNEKDKINEIICIETDKIIKYLGFDSNIANTLIDLNERMPRSLNAQASLTVNDVRNICDYCISR